MRRDIGARFLSRGAATCAGGRLLLAGLGEVLEVRLRCGPVLFLDGFPDLLSIDRDLPARLDAEADSGSGYLEDGDLDVVAEADSLTGLTRDDEHRAASLPLDRGCLHRHFCLCGQ